MKNEKLSKVILGIVLFVCILAVLVLGIVFGESSAKTFKNEVQEAKIQYQNEQEKNSRVPNIEKNFDKTVKAVFEEKLGEYPTLVKADASDVQLENSTLVARYSFALKDGKKGDMYILDSKSAFEQILTLAVIYTGTPGVDLTGVDVVMIESDENDYYNTFVNPNNNKPFVDLINSASRLVKWLKAEEISSNEYLKTYSSISGATKSTEAVVHILKDARIQVYTDYQVAVPEPDEIVDIQSVSQQAGPLVFDYQLLFKSAKVAKQTITFSATYNIETKQFAFVSSSIELSDEDKALVCANLSLPTVVIIETNDDVYLVRTTNSFSAVITVKVTATEKTITSVEILEGGSADSRGIFDDSKMQSNIMNVADLSNADTIEVVSGSTVTSNCIKDCLKTLNSWLEGGNK